MEALLVYPTIYILKLEDDCYYIGITMDLNKRLSQHWSGKGAKWTMLHKPISVEKVIFPVLDSKMENELTLEYMEKFGKDKVKGGYYCKV